MRNSILTVLQNMIQWYSRDCVTITTISKNFHHSQQKLCTLSRNAHCLLSGPCDHCSTSVSVDLPVLDVRHCRDQTMGSLLCLAQFTYHNVFSMNSTSFPVMAN